MLAKQKGLTLVELMVAMVLGLIITGVVLQVFLSNKTTFLLQDQMGRLQDNGRFALQYLASEIRPAGNGNGVRFSGDQMCVASAAGQNIFDQVSMPVSGYRATNQSIGGKAVVPGSDVINVSSTDSCVAWVDGNWKPSGTATMKASAYCPSMAKDKAVMAFDLNQAVIFSITSNVNASATNPNLSHAASNNGTSDCGGHRFNDITFDNTARIVGFGNSSYFVANTGRVDNVGRPVRALWVRNNLAPAGEQGPFEVIEGIDSMRVSYGIATPNGQAVREYVSTAAMTAADWPRVRSLKLELLLVSEQNAPGAAQQSITFDGAAVAADGRLRQVYSTVVALRNMID